MVNDTAADLDQVRQAAASVVDPEIPVLTVADLGVLRSVETEGDRIVVSITPTYSGCPAMRQIAEDIRAAVREAGVDDVEIRIAHSPAWTTDWISEQGRHKLARFGIAPPDPENQVLCPRCDAPAPRMVSRFGSTACKAFMVCSSCGEPFDYFKRL